MVPSAAMDFTSSLFQHGVVITGIGGTALLQSQRFWIFRTVNQGQVHPDHHIENAFFVQLAICIWQLLAVLVILMGKMYEATSEYVVVPSPNWNL